MRGRETHDNDTNFYSNFNACLQNVENVRHLEIDPSSTASICVKAASFAAFGQHFLRAQENTEQREDLNGTSQNCNK
jgi:hypothetical protein